MDSIRTNRTVSAEHVRAKMTAFKKKWEQEAEEGSRPQMKSCELSPEARDGHFFCVDKKIWIRFRATHAEKGL
jgi:hypothetical protein